MSHKSTDYSQENAFIKEKRIFLIEEIFWFWITVPKESHSAKTIRTNLESIHKDFLRLIRSSNSQEYF